MLRTSEKEQMEILRKRMMGKKFKEVKILTEINGSMIMDSLIKIREDNLGVGWSRNLDSEKEEGKIDFISIDIGREKTNSEYHFEDFDRVDIVEGKGFFEIAIMKDLQDTRTIIKLVKESE